jgi:hypothetical protein
LDFYYNSDGQPTWGASTVAGIGSTYGPPAITRFNNGTSQGTIVVAQGPNNSLDFYYNVDGQPHWGASTVAGVGSTYGPPAITRFNNGTSQGTIVVAQGVVTGPVSTLLPQPRSQSPPASTTLPQPKKGRHSLRVRLTVTWTWAYGTTWLDKATIGRLPSHTRLAVHCLGRRCPRPAMVSAAGPRSVQRLLRALRGQRYEVGERLRITLTAPGFRPEKADVIFRYARLPTIRLLSS